MQQELFQAVSVIMRGLAMSFITVQYERFLAGSFITVYEELCVAVSFSNVQY